MTRKWYCNLAPNSKSLFQRNYYVARDMRKIRYLRICLLLIFHEESQGCKFVKLKCTLMQNNTKKWLRPFFKTNKNKMISSVLIQYFLRRETKGPVTCVERRGGLVPFTLFIEVESSPWNFNQFYIFSNRFLWQLLLGNLDLISKYSWSLSMRIFYE